MTGQPNPSASYGQTEALALAVVDDETLLAGLDPILAAHVAEPAPCRTHKASGPARQLPTITRGTAQPNKEDIHVQSYRH